MNRPARRPFQRPSGDFEVAYFEMELASLHPQVEILPHIAAPDQDGACRRPLTVAAEDLDLLGGQQDIIAAFAHRLAE